MIVMSRSAKMIYNFPTELNLEVMMKSGVWVRVTCDTFRSYYGPRRIDGEAYNGICYYRDTNHPYKGKKPFIYKTLCRSDYTTKVGKNYNPVKRRF